MNTAQLKAFMERPRVSHMLFSTDADWIEPVSQKLYEHLGEPADQELPYATTLLVELFVQKTLADFGVDLNPELEAIGV